MLPKSIGNVNLHVAPMHQDEPRLAHNVVLRMVNNLAYVKHIVAIYNFFSSI